MGLIAVIIVVVVGIGGGVGYVIYEDQQSKQPVADDSNTNQGVVEVSQPRTTTDGVGLEKSSSRIEDASETPAIEVESRPKIALEEAEPRYRALLEETQARKKLDGMKALLEVCPDEILDQVRANFAAAVDHYEGVLDEQLATMADTIESHRNNMDLPELIAIYGTLLDEYGDLLHEGRLGKQRDAYIKQQRERFEEHDRAAVQAIATGGYELARRLYLQIVDYGNETQVNRAREQLAVLQELAPDEALLTDEEIAAVKKRAAEAERAARERREKAAAGKVAKKDTGLPGRLGIINGRLDELLKVKKKKLMAGGMLELTYEFLRQDRDRQRGLVATGVSG